MSTYVQTTNFTPITFAGADTWLVPTSIVVTGVFSQHFGSTLLNHGDIEGAMAVSFQSGSNNYLINAAEGIIAGNFGAYAGNQYNSVTVTILNYGSITADSRGVEFGANATGCTLDNRGSIYGQSYGIDDESTGGLAATITNRGTVEGGSFGVYAAPALGDVEHITNLGTIAGGVASIFSLGSLILSNSGTLSGGVSVGPNGNFVDTIVNSGTIVGSVHLAGGNDVFTGTGGSSGTVFGENGNDRLIGGSCADKLSGGDGNDTLTGGAGKDHFVFDSALNASSNVDRITDFTHGVDKIDLSHAIFSKLNASGALQAGMFFAGAAAHDAGDHIVYNPANGWLTYDDNGSAAGGAIHFATLAAHLMLATTDFLVVA